MKKLLFLIFTPLLLVSCKSKEEKAQELINQEMRKTLLDYSSYEPITTEVDSAFKSIYTNKTARRYAKKCDIFESRFQHEMSMMKIYGDAMNDSEGKSYMKDIWDNAYNKYSVSLEISRACLDTIGIYQDSIKILNADLKREFFGWMTIHKFRAKSKLGLPVLYSRLYIFDNDFKNIIYTEDVEDEYNIKIRKFIDEALYKE